MIPVADLLCAKASGRGETDDAADRSLPYCVEADASSPVVVWNVTRQCNLYCSHCYAAAESQPAAGEFTTAEAKAFLEDLAAAEVPAVSVSGGEPLLREDLVDLIEHASSLGVQPVLTTNGSLLTRENAAALAAAGLRYVAVSVDGLPDHHDRFRGRNGAFAAARRGVDHCLEAGLETGVRYTVSRANADDLEDVLEHFASLDIDRFCLAHLEYGGRGAEIADADLSPQATREVVTRLCELTLAYYDRGEGIETLLDGNFADAGYLVEFARDHFDEERARAVHDRLDRIGGDPTGERVAGVDSQGNVHPSPFWREYSLGNVRDRPFDEIWTDETNPLIEALRDRETRLRGRCRECRHRSICRGGSRVRALSTTGDPFAPDPKCYLSEDERTGERPVDGSSSP